MSYQLCIYPDPLDAACELTLDSGIVAMGEKGTYKDRPCQCFTIPEEATNGHGCTLKITHEDKTMLLQRAVLFLKQPGFPYPWDEKAGQTAAFAADDFYLQDAATFPTDPPTRLEMLQVNMHFRGGVIVDSPIYGTMPWYDACLTWCDTETRKRAYDAGHQAEDTHKILHIPNGKPLYADYNPANFYNPSRFPALDWTNGMTRLDSRFTDMVDEIVMNGFKVIITMDEVYAYSIQIVRMVMEALEPRQLPWVMTWPGYDGVFYGWEPSNDLIPGWAKLARSIRPDCILGILFNSGHIPLGNGPADYQIGGLMDGYDCVFGQFPTVPPDLNSEDDCNRVWQILGRMITPYHRDPNQPPGEDTNPPFYLVPSPRGERTFVAFETWNPYDWVRRDPNDDQEMAEACRQIQIERDYFKARGCHYIG